MSCPMASIINPLNADEILLFYLIDQGTAGLERHNFGNNTYNAIKFTDNGVPTVDSIANPGSFSALTFNGLLNVYGLVKEPIGGVVSTTTPTAKTPVEANKTKRIAQLSPVYKLLTSDDTVKAAGIALTTIVDDEGQAWMYYIAIKNNAPAISEIKLGWDQSSVTTTVTTSPPLLSTNLASAFDPKSKKRLIVYQNDKTLRIVESSGNNDGKIPNTGDSQDSTGIALVPVKTIQGVKLYLYYFSNKEALLQRVIRDEDGNWKGSNAVEGATEAEKTTFLTATKVGGKIVLFYMASENKKSIYVFKDVIQD